MKYIHIDNEEYYEDRFSDCCDLPIFFQTDICVGCQKHTTYKIINMNIDITKESLLFLERILISELELALRHKDKDAIQQDHFEKVNKALTEIQEQL
tara:strand:+ start:213 stop:503 length:291 start_codon:yes stop_codon:yes gene_type:complete